MDKKITGSEGREVYKGRLPHVDKRGKSALNPVPRNLSQRELFKESGKVVSAEQRIVKQRAEPKKSSGWIGTDESGKGDYFGPLVVAGVYLEDNLLPKLKVLNVRDSKKISDGVIKELDFKLRSFCCYSVVVIGPEKYNLLYAKMKNLNRILAWGHARVIENILLQIDAPKAISDQFGDELYIKNALLKLGKKIRLEQRPGAESDLAVAAASILARAEFLKRLEGLSRDCGMILPKGASPLTEEMAKKLVEKLGKENLEKYVKMHFKNTNKVLFPQEEKPAQS
jgi:ribonuclease HIII